MTIKELLLQEIESSTDPLLEETLDFLRFLKTKLASTQPETHTEVSDSQVTTQTDKPIQSTGQNLLKHLKSIGTWEGDDFEEVLRWYMPLAVKPNSTMIAIPLMSNVFTRH